jgi:hypothetical protein
MNKELMEGTTIVYREPDTMIVVAESPEEIYSQYLSFGEDEDQQQEVE